MPAPGALFHYLDRRSADSAETAIPYRRIIREAQRAGYPVLSVEKELASSLARRAGEAFGVVQRGRIGTVLDRDGLRCYANYSRWH